MIALGTKRPRFEAITGMQVISLLRGYDGQLSRDTAKFGTYAKYRLLRKDPTIALGRGLLVSGILAGGWSVEADEDTPDAVVEFVKTLLPLREDIMRTAVGYGRVDFGWMPYEKIFGIENGLITLVHLKPLLHDMTTILVDPNGNFQGYKQRNTLTAIPIEVPAEYCFHVAFDVEGSNLYGVPLLENIRATQAAWDECNDGAKRYDEKAAGSHWILHYPEGTSVVDGESIPNSELATQILELLKSSGLVSLPTSVADVAQEVKNETLASLYAWRVELLSDSSPRQGPFIKRLKYLDSLKMRGLILPERAGLEGQFGTKAEAGAHIGLAITHMQEIDRTVTRQVNRQIVSQLLTLNFGDALAYKARLVAAPLVDLEAEFLRKLYLALVVTDAGSIDTTALKEQLSVPIGKEQENAES